MSLRRSTGKKNPGDGSKKDAPLAQLAEQLTLNQWVPGSSPGGCTTGKTAFGLWKHKPEAVLLCALSAPGFPCLRVGSAEPHRLLRSCRFQRGKRQVPSN